MPALQRALNHAEFSMRVTDLAYYISPMLFEWVRLRVDRNAVGFDPANGDQVSAAQNRSRQIETISKTNE